MIAGHDGEPPCVRAAKEFIRLHAFQPLNAQAVARHAGCSVRHLARLMKRSSGLTFHQYLALVRFEHAKALLAGSNLQIKEIASRDGFLHLEEFDRMFRRLAGACPSAYRASLGKQ
jgi:AraC-like DNA-binding protein